jgi:DNA polymerase
MKKEELSAQVNKAIRSCKKCRLCKTRKNPVCGEGSLDASIMFVGEAPGQNEDEQGRPFVGRAGILLSDMLSKIKLKREDVWIGNVVKCRPPENRAPMVDELRSCSGYLESQIKMINPKLLVLLGRFALEHFIKDAKISKEHGVAQVWKDRVIYPLYHPAAALRSPQVAEILMREFKKIPTILEECPKLLSGRSKNLPKENGGQILLV